MPRQARHENNFKSMNFKQKFYDITNLVQQEFNRNADKYGDKLQCRRGCSKCCSQIFNITLLDAYIIQEHIKSLPPERQAVLKSKAKEYLLNKHLPLKKEVAGLSRTSEAERGGFGLPCPALGAEGECTIYEARPVICRRFGIPIYDYKNPGNLYACELNFSQGEEIIDAQLVPNQTAIGMKWDELKEEYLKALPLTKGEYPKWEGVEKEKGYTTIAEAIANVM